jgi:hypothetical protein
VRRAPKSKHRVTPQIRHLVFLLKRRPVRAHLIDADKALLRKFLSEPVRAYKFPVDGATEDQRKKQTDPPFLDEALIKRHKLETKASKAREEALFALYAIPADWSPDVQWEQLARHLAGELFAGCRTLLKPRGGKRPGKHNPRRAELFAKLKTYKSDIPEGKTRQRAFEFFRKHKAECSAAGLNTNRSFYQAMKKSDTTSIAMLLVNKFLIF